jgi:hypothetical protein
VYTSPCTGFELTTLVVIGTEVALNIINLTKPLDTGIIMLYFIMVLYSFLHFFVLIKSTNLLEPKSCVNNHVINTGSSEF